MTRDAVQQGQLWPLCGRDGRSSGWRTQDSDGGRRVAGRGSPQVAEGAGGGEGGNGLSQLQEMPAGGGGQLEGETQGLRGQGGVGRLCGELGTGACGTRQPLRQRVGGGEARAESGWGEPRLQGPVREGQKGNPAGRPHWEGRADAGPGSPWLSCGFRGDGGVPRPRVWESVQIPVGPTARQPPAVLSDPVKRL